MAGLQKWENFGSLKAASLSKASLCSGTRTARTIWRNHGKGGLCFFPSTPTSFSLFLKKKNPGSVPIGGRSFSCLVWESCTCRCSASLARLLSFGLVPLGCKGEQHGTTWNICDAADSPNECESHYEWLMGTTAVNTDVGLAGKYVPVLCGSCSLPR